MDNFIQFIKTDEFLIITFIINIILLIGFIVNIIKFSKLDNKYKNFMKKIGEGKNIEEDLETFMHVVRNVEKRNEEISNYIKEIEGNLKTCIKKVGMVRYSAFQDTGSDLSFSLALLDEYNTGVVLNGIYSREMSNIYAKPIKEGKSSYTLSDEEKEAIRKAIEGEKK